MLSRTVSRFPNVREVGLDGHPDFRTASNTFPWCLGEPVLTFVSQYYVIRSGAALVRADSWSELRLRMSVSGNTVHIYEDAEMVRLSSS